MSTHIRRATVADAELLSSLNADVQQLHAAAMPERFKPPGQDTFPAAEIGALLTNLRNLVFIAEVDNRPVGYAYAEIVSLQETSLRHAWEEVHLHHISVRPAYRRRGVARHLLEAVRAAGRERGIGLVTLQVWSFNDDARAFFRREGFSPYMERLWSR